MIKKLFMFIFTIFIILILIYSISFLWSEKKESSNNKDIKETIEIDGSKLEVTYLEGNVLNEDIAYNNKVKKIIKIENNNDKAITFALNIESLSMTSSGLLYNISYSVSNEDYYNIIKEDTLLVSKYISSNLSIEALSSIYLKLEILSSNENMVNLKGQVKVIDNSSPTEIFLSNAILIKESIDAKINDLNGINNKGYYIATIPKENIIANYEGFIFIDASDVSSLKYNLFIWNDKYMLYNIKFDELNENKVKEKDSFITSEINSQNICSIFTKETCIDISNIKYSEYGGKNNFLKYADELINYVNEDFNKRNLSNKVYIYDIVNDINYKTPINLSGYILINNQNSKPETYVYLTNQIFMISGYNITRYGSISPHGTTIRGYNTTAFDLAAKDKNSVCAFTKLGSCYNLDNTLIK